MQESNGNMGLKLVINEIISARVIKINEMRCFLDELLSEDFLGYFTNIQEQLEKIIELLDIEIGELKRILNREIPFVLTSKIPAIEKEIEFPCIAKCENEFYVYSGCSVNNRILIEENEVFVAFFNADNADSQKTWLSVAEISTVVCEKTGFFSSMFSKKNDHTRLLIDVALENKVSLCENKIKTIFVMLLKVDFESEYADIQLNGIYSVLNNEQLKPEVKINIIGSLFEEKRRQKLEAQIAAYKEDMAEKVERFLQIENSDFFIVRTIDYLCKVVYPENSTCFQTFCPLQEEYKKWGQLYILLQEADQKDSVFILQEIVKLQQSIINALPGYPEMIERYTYFLLDDKMYNYAEAWQRLMCSAENEKKALNILKSFSYIVYMSSGNKPEPAKDMQHFVGFLNNIICSDLSQKQLDNIIPSVIQILGDRVFKLIEAYAIQPAKQENSIIDHIIMSMARPVLESEVYKNFVIECLELEGKVNKSIFKLDNKEVVDKSLFTLIKEKKDNIVVDENFTYKGKIISLKDAFFNAIDKLFETNKYPVELQRIIFALRNRAGLVGYIVNGFINPVIIRYGDKTDDLILKFWCKEIIPFALQALDIKSNKNQEIEMKKRVQAFTLNSILKEDMQKHVNNLCAGSISKIQAKSFKKMPINSDNSFLEQDIFHSIKLLEYRARLIGFEKYLMQLTEKVDLRKEIRTSFDCDLSMLLLNDHDKNTPKPALLELSGSFVLLGSSETGEDIYTNVNDKLFRDRFEDGSAIRILTYSEIYETEIYQIIKEKKAHHLFSTTVEQDRNSFENQLQQLNKLKEKFSDLKIYDEYLFRLEGEFQSFCKDYDEYTSERQIALSEQKNKVERLSNILSFEFAKNYNEIDEGLIDVNFEEGENNDNIDDEEYQSDTDEAENQYQYDLFKDICGALLPRVADKNKCGACILIVSNENSFQSLVKKLMDFSLSEKKPMLFMSKQPGAESQYICGLINYRDEKKKNDLILINTLENSMSELEHELLELCGLDGNVILKIIPSSGITPDKPYCESNGLASCIIALALSLHIVRTLSSQTFESFYDVNNLFSEKFGEFRKAVNSEESEIMLLEIHNAHIQLLHSLELQISQAETPVLNKDNKNRHSGRADSSLSRLIKEDEIISIQGDVAINSMKIDESNIKLVIGEKAADLVKDCNNISLQNGLSAHVRINEEGLQISFRDAGDAMRLHTKLKIGAGLKMNDKKIESICSSKEYRDSHSLVYKGTVTIPDKVDNIQRFIVDVCKLDEKVFQILHNVRSGNNINSNFYPTPPQSISRSQSISSSSVSIEEQQQLEQLRQKKL